MTTQRVNGDGFGGRIIEERPQAIGRTAGANPWWHHRQPRNDAERLELAAARFTPNEQLEMLLVVRDRFPDVLDEASTERQAEIEAYAESRAAAIVAGKDVPDLRPGRVMYVEQWAERVRATRAVRSPQDVHAERRVAFCQMVAAGAPDVDVRTAFIAWVAAVRDANQAMTDHDGAREALGLMARKSGARAALPEYSAAIADAVNAAAGLGTTNRLLMGRHA